MPVQFCKIVYMPCVWFEFFFFGGGGVSFPEQRVQGGGCGKINRQTMYGKWRTEYRAIRQKCHFVHPLLYVMFCQYACLGNEHRRGLIIIRSCLSWPLEVCRQEFHRTSGRWSIETTGVPLRHHPLSFHGALHNNSVGIVVCLVHQRYVHLDVIVA